MLAQFWYNWAYPITNKKKPYNATDARHVDFLKFEGRGAPMVVDIGGVRPGMSELLQAVYTMTLGICCGFALILNLNFGFPNFGGRGVGLTMPA